MGAFDVLRAIRAFHAAKSQIVRRRSKFYEQHLAVQTKFRETRGHLADPGIGPTGIFPGPGPEISSDYRFYDRLWDGG